MSTIKVIHDGRLTLRRTKGSNDWDEATWHRYKMYKEKTETKDSYPYYWRIKKQLPERFKTRCRLLASGKMNSVLIEFEDGLKVITNRYFIRRLA